MAEKKKKDDIRENIMNKTEEMKEQAQEMKEQAQARMKEARKKLSQMNDTMVDYITENPIKSVLIAAAVGMVIGKMMAHRKG